MECNLLRPKNYELVKSVVQERQFYANFSKIIREGILFDIYKISPSFNYEIFIMR